MDQIEMQKQVADEWVKMFEQRQKDDGDEIWSLRDGAAGGDWESEHPLRAAIREAHGNMPPDDHKYRFVVESLYAIVDHDGDIESARDSIEADIYDADLLKWLSSHVERAGYVDEYVKEYTLGLDGSEFSTMRVIQCGQWLEKTEVFDIVARYVEDEAEARLEAE